SMPAGKRMPVPMMKLPVNRAASAPGGGVAAPVSTERAFSGVISRLLRAMGGGVYRPCEHDRPHDFAHAKCTCPENRHDIGSHAFTRWVVDDYANQESWRHWCRSNGE